MDLIEVHSIRKKYIHTDLFKISSSLPWTPEMARYIALKFPRGPIVWKVPGGIPLISWKGPLYEWIPLWSFDLSEVPTHKSCYCIPPFIYTCNILLECLTESGTFYLCYGKVWLLAMWSFFWESYRDLFRQQRFYKLKYKFGVQKYTTLPWFNKEVYLLGYRFSYYDLK